MADALGLAAESTQTMRGIPEIFLVPIAFVHPKYSKIGKLAGSGGKTDLNVQICASFRVESIE